jgi:hypothetical protein
MVTNSVVPIANPPVARATMAIANRTGVTGLTAVSELAVSVTTA